MPRFLTVLEIWRFGPHQHRQPQACSEGQHNVTNTREAMTANQVDPDVTNKLLSSEASTAGPWPESTRDEQNVITQPDNYGLNDDSNMDTDTLTSTDTQRTESSMSDSDSHDIIFSSEMHQKDDMAQLLASLRGPVSPRDLDNSHTAVQAVILMQSDDKSGCYGADELRQNADRVPAGEDGRPIKDKQDKRCDVKSVAGNHEKDMKESGYPSGTEAAIGPPLDDSRLRTPPVEGWPYADSWTSSCSDKVHSPDEYPAIVIPTLSAMAIKDRAQEPQQSEGDSPGAEMTHLAKDAEDHGGPAAERGGEKVQTQIKILAGASDNQSPAHGDKEEGVTSLTEDSSPVASGRCLSPPCTVAFTSDSASCVTDVMPSSGFSTTIAVSEGSTGIISVGETELVGGNDMGINSPMKACSQEEEKVRSSECQDTSEVQQETEQESNPLWEVTEDTLSSLDLVIKKGVERSNGSVRISGYHSQPSAVEGACREEPGDSPERPSTALHRAVGTVHRDACVPVHTSHQIQHAEEEGSALSHRTEVLFVQNQGEKKEGPNFIMPLAPLCQRSSRICADIALEGDQQRGRFLNTALNGIFDRTTRALSLENQKEKLSHEKLTAGSGQKEPSESSLPGDSHHPLSVDSKINKVSHSISNLSNELSKLTILTGDNFMVNEEDHTACITLNLDDISDPSAPLTEENGNCGDSTSSSLEHVERENICETEQQKSPEMPHKTFSSSSKTSSECTILTSHKNEEKPASCQETSKQPAAPMPKTQETALPESLGTCEAGTDKTGQEDDSVTVIETIVITEKITTKSRGKKKKKHTQHAPVKVEAETLKVVENCSQPKPLKQKTDALDTRPATQSATKNDKPSAAASKKDCLKPDNRQKPIVKNAAGASKARAKLVDDSLSVTAAKETPAVKAGLVDQPNKDILKCDHLPEDKGGNQLAEPKKQTLERSSLFKNDERPIPAETGRRMAYSEVVKQKPRAQKEDNRKCEVPKVLQNIRAEKLSDDPESISLLCQFSAVSVDSTVAWTKEGVILTRTQRSTGDESPLCFTISKASSKDLGRYQCCLSCSHGTATSEFHLTSDVLHEFIPCQIHPVGEVEGVGEDVRCAPLLFRDDFLSEQYFGDNQPASIVTEDAHFGEGMHRRAFRAKLVGGMLSTFTPGHPCVLKVHNAISQGTKNNEELIHKNYSLAVEECFVQNTAREYIKAYTMVAKSAEAFGEVPEIIPIFLVHRPSNDIPYATLEEELMGDFVKYSVKDGKEINLTRRDSEAGQKCCAFQHWVYHITEGNLLVTDMQGVGMKLTDVGIATPKKGYKGFKGNCGTSFIDQFKALHQCNKFCELLGLKSLQPAQQKPKRTGSAPKPKSQPQTKKKTFAFNLKSKS